MQISIVVSVKDGAEKEIVDDVTRHLKEKHGDKLLNKNIEYYVKNLQIKTYKK